MRASLDHVGIAVSSLTDALAFYRDTLGLEVEAPEDVASQGVRAHFIPVSDTAEGVKGVPPTRNGGAGDPGLSLELLEATAEDSPIARFIAKRGPGLHHVALRVEDIIEALAELKARGIRLIDETPRPGAHGSLVAFLHPSSTHGVLVEVKQAAAGRSGSE